IQVDSEQSAIHQCIFSRDWTSVKRIYLTSSGGPFFGRKSRVASARIEDVLKHPTWKMGKKITVDSATLMNKGLEVIEAARLFGYTGDRIKILIHPQSIVHSLVEFIDHSLISQLSVPDMRLPIQYALTFPKRMVSLAKSCDLTKVGHLDFYPADFDEFPCLRLAYQALKIGGTMPAVLNGANEMAVNLFLENKMRFNQIPEMIAQTMAMHRVIKKPDFEEIEHSEKWAEDYVRRLV
ncbi:MAG: 1-deoxy-D-xylulose-5-phosphate reductoisomerase, partial [candidate division WOR-3 bacterium]